MSNQQEPGSGQTSEGRKIIFLDLDGVINTPRTWGLRGLAAIDQDKVERIEHLCQLTGAEVVISSSWRTVLTLDEIRDRLTARGLGPARIVDVTPFASLHSIGSRTPRADEIKAWLRHHPEVIGFVVIDDDADAGIPNHFVRTVDRYGFEGHLIGIAVRILEKRVAIREVVPA